MILAFFLNVSGDRSASQAGTYWISRLQKNRTLRQSISYASHIPCELPGIRADGRDGSSWVSAAERLRYSLLVLSHSTERLAGFLQILVQALTQISTGLPVDLRLEFLP